LRSSGIVRLWIKVTVGWLGTNAGLYSLAYEKANFGRLELSAAKPNKAKLGLPAQLTRLLTETVLIDKQLT
jgi:hypothetical protein